MSAMGQPRPASLDFWRAQDGSASKPDVPARLGKPVRHPGHASPTQEDDHGDPSASNVLTAATRALEQGQAHWPEATVAGKTCLVDQPVLTSSAFANVEGIKRRLVSVGRYALRGVAHPQELFTFDPDA